MAIKPLVISPYTSSLFYIYISVGFMIF